MVTTTTSSLKGKYRQPFHDKRSNGDKILDQLKYQQKVYSLELQRSRSFVLNPLVDLVDMKDDIPTIYAKFGYIFDRSVDAGLLKN